MAPNYLSIRHSHFRITLRGWLRGLDKALVAIAAALTFILTAIVGIAVVGMAQGLMLLSDAGARPAHRIAVIAAWQAISFVLVRALREAALMPRARPFFDALPIPPALQLRADLVLALFTYSFLWLPVAWVLADPLGMRTSPLPATLPSLAALIVLSLGLNLTLLRARPWHALVCLAALLAFTALRGAAAWLEGARAGCALLAIYMLWQSYQPGAARAPVARRRSELADQVSIRSGLVIPLLANELRANFMVRVGAILATLGACLLVIELRTNDTSTASVLLFVAAVAALALYSLPALLRRTLLTKLQFLAGQPAFAARMRKAVYVIPSALFLVALAAGGMFDRGGRAWLEASWFSALYGLGVVGARAGFRLTTWIVPFAAMMLLIILGAMT